jgi:hypothetical protein
LATNSHRDVKTGIYLAGLVFIKTWVKNQWWIPVDDRSITKKLILVSKYIMASDK